MKTTVTEQSRLDCEQCISYITPAVVGACASVGIERGKPTWQVLNEYLADYHRRGHTRESR